MCLDRNPACHIQDELQYFATFMASMNGPFLNVHAYITKIVNRLALTGTGQSRRFVVGAVLFVCCGDDGGCSIWQLVLLASLARPFLEALHKRRYK